MIWPGGKFEQLENEKDVEKNGSEERISDGMDGNRWLSEIKGFSAEREKKTRRAYRFQFQQFCIHFWFLIQQTRLSSQSN